MNRSNPSTLGVLNFVVVIGLSIGLVGMFLWTLTLSSRVHTGVAADGSLAAPSEEQHKIDALNRRVDANENSIHALRGADARADRRIDDLEKRVGLEGKALAAQGGKTDEKGNPADASPDQLKVKVKEILDERAAEQRKQRMQRFAQWQSRMLLRGVQATDQQRQQFEKVIATYMSDVRDIRQKYSGADADRQARDDALKQATDQRNQDVEQIFGAADYEKVKSNLDRLSRFAGGRGRGGAFRGRGGNRGTGGGR